MTTHYCGMVSDHRVHVMYSTVQYNSTHNAMRHQITDRLYLLLLPEFQVLIEEGVIMSYQTCESQ